MVETAETPQIEMGLNGEETVKNTLHPHPENHYFHQQASTIGIVEYKENTEHAIVFQDLSYSINKLITRCPFRKTITILRDISGYIPRNCLCGIIGQSGAGKTTLLGLLAGIPKSGTKTGYVAVSSKKIAFVSQVPHISQTEKVGEILTFAASVTYIGPTDDEKHELSSTKRFDIISNRVTKVLETLNLSRVRQRQIRYLSGGELKRVSIAMQLMTNPDILILDEPTSGLDTPNALQIVQTLRKIVKTLNCTVVMSIHQPHKRICDCMDWMLSLKDGLLLYQGALPEALKCRDILLNEIVHKLTGNGPKSIGNGISTLPIPERTDIIKVAANSIDIDELSADIVYHSDDNMDNGEIKEKREDIKAPFIMDEYFDMKLIANLSNLYNIDIVKDDESINYNLLGSLISDIMKDGHNTANAADYLLETEYLSTTDKLQSNWINYRDKKYPSFIQTLDESLLNNLNFENKICGCCDINNCMGCDVTHYFKDLCHCNTYIHAFWAFIGLSLRALRYYQRKWWIIPFNEIISIAAAVILGLIYGKMSDEQDDIQNRFGAFGFVCIFIGIQAVAASGTFHEIRDVFIDDRNAKLYGATPFLFARTIPDLLLLRIGPSVTFGYILFEMLGLQEDTEDFLQRNPETDKPVQDTFGSFMAVIILLSCASSLCVFAISSLMPDAYIAGFVAIFINMLFMLYGGVFIQDESVIPVYVEWPKELSFYNFAFEILMVNEFTGLSFKIDDATVTVGGIPITFDADQVNVRLSGVFFLEFFGMNPDDIQRDWIMLIMWCCIYLFIAWCSLETLYRSRR